MYCINENTCPLKDNCLLKNILYIEQPVTATSTNSGIRKQLVELHSKFYLQRIKDYSAPISITISIKTIQNIHQELELQSRNY